MLLEGKYNIILSFFLFFTNIASLFISLVEQEKVVEMYIYDGVLKAKAKHEKSSFQLYPGSEKNEF